MDEMAYSQGPVLWTGLGLNWKVYNFFNDNNSESSCKLGYPFAKSKWISHWIPNLLTPTRQIQNSWYKHKLFDSWKSVINLHNNKKEVNYCLKKDFIMKELTQQTVHGFKTNWGFLFGFFLVTCWWIRKRFNKW